MTEIIDFDGSGNNKKVKVKVKKQKTRIKKVMVIFIYTIIVFVVSGLFVFNTSPEAHIIAKGILMLLGIIPYLLYVIIKKKKGGGWLRSLINKDGMRVHITVDPLFTPEIKKTTEKMYGEDAIITYEDTSDEDIDPELLKQYKVKIRKENGFTIRTFTKREKPEYFGILIMIIAIFAVMYFYLTGQIKTSELVQQGVTVAGVGIVLALFATIQRRKNKK